MDFLGENGLARLWEHVTSKLNTKVNKVNGMGLSSNDYTVEDKDKLLNIESGAQVNTVTSVNGKTGAITLTASDLGISYDGTDSNMTLDLAKEYTNKIADSKADAIHVHNASDITDLETSLDTRVPISRTINGKELIEDIILVSSDIRADEIGSAESALANAKLYTNDLIATKSDIGHTHDDMYYTEGEIDTKVIEINSSITGIIEGTTMVGKANNALTADSAITAISAEKATMDSSGNVFEEVYETKANTTSILSESKSYTDSVKNDLLNGAGEAYDTLKELGELIDDNTDAIDALEIVATGKADKVHVHVIEDVEDLRNSLDNKASVSHEHNISDVTNLQKELTDIQTELNTKANTNHTHNYAGSTNSGGAANSANKLNTSAGSSIKPVYFANGVPVETTYTVEKSVPSDAVFTDTTYSVVTQFASGLMSAEDKIKLDNIQSKTLTEHLEEEQMILTSLQYGDELPETGVPGRIFFKRVIE